MSIISKNIEYQSKITEELKKQLQQYKSKFSKIDNNLNNNQIRIGNKIISKKIIGSLKEQYDFINKIYPSIKEELDKRVIKNIIIKETDEYQELNNLYQKFLNKIINQLVDLNLDKKEVGYIELLIGTLIKQNYLSTNMNYIKKYNKIDIDSLTDILGTRVMTNDAYCRNISKLTYDILNKLNIDSSPYTLINKENDMRHIVIARNTKKGIIYIDPTNLEVAVPNKEGLLFHSLSNNIIETYLKKYFLYILNFDDDIDKLQKYYYLNDSKDIDIEYFKDIYKEMNDIIKAKSIIFKKFKYKNLNDIKNIAYYNYLITYEINKKNEKTKNRILTK